MEVTCCFQKLGGGVCASDKRYEGAVIVPLSSCQKDILGHTRSIGVSAINSEVELAINIFSSARHFVLDHLPIPSFFPGHLLAPRCSSMPSTARAIKACFQRKNEKGGAWNKQVGVQNKQVFLFRQAQVSTPDRWFVAFRCKGICLDCRPIIDVKEKTLEDVPKTTLNVADISEGTGKIILVSLIILMTCIILTLKEFIKLTNYALSLFIRESQVSSTQLITFNKNMSQGSVSLGLMLSTLSPPKK